MAHNLRVELWEASDVDRLMNIILKAFENEHTERLLQNTSSPQNLRAAGIRHLEAIRSHSTTGIKCIFTDADSDAETIMATAHWTFYVSERPASAYLQPHYLLSASWVEDQEKRAQAIRQLKPVIDGRIKWFAGKPHALLMHMVCDPAWQRRGAATACIRWGLQRCDELGIPAYLEASEEGAPVYERLGFEKMDEVVGEQDGVPFMYPAMIRWPPGTSAADKKPAIPDHESVEHSR